jgi:hypothetical protein
MRMAILGAVLAGPHLTSTLEPRPHDGAAHDRIESVQILRGLAAFSVMMAHLTYGNGNFYAHLPEVGNLFHYGSLGVYSFFVIRDSSFRTR